MTFSANKAKMLTLNTISRLNNSLLRSIANNKYIFYWRYLILNQLSKRINKSFYKINLVDFALHGAKASNFIVIVYLSTNNYIHLITPLSISVKLITERFKIIVDKGVNALSLFIEKGCAKTVEVVCVFV